MTLQQSLLVVHTLAQGRKLRAKPEAAAKSRLQTSSVRLHGAHGLGGPNKLHTTPSADLEQDPVAVGLVLRTSVPRDSKKPSTKE